MLLGLATAECVATFIAQYALKIMAAMSVRHLTRMQPDMRSKMSDHAVSVRNMKTEKKDYKALAKYYGDIVRNSTVRDSDTEYEALAAYYASLVDDRDEDE